MKRSTFNGFAVCIKNRGYAASLEPRKIYRLLRDAQAAARGLLRVIDETGEDYLYPAEYFAPIRLTPALRRVFSARR